MGYVAVGFITFVIGTVVGAMLMALLCALKDEDDA